MTSFQDEEIDLDALRSQRSSTPRSEQSRCPECGSVRIKRKTNDWRGARDRHENYVCDNCFHHFDEPADPPRVVTDGGYLDPDAFAIPTIEDLDAIRTAYNLSQKELSRRAGMEPGRFHHILQHDVDPQTNTMRAFLEVLQEAEPRGPEDVERTGPKPKPSSLIEKLEETDADDVATDGGSVQPDSDETDGRSVDDIDRYQSRRRAAGDNGSGRTEIGRRLNIPREEDEPPVYTSRGVQSNSIVTETAQDGDVDE